jgi:hypothetical protein
VGAVAHVDDERLRWRGDERGAVYSDEPAIDPAQPIRRGRTAGDGSEGSGASRRWPVLLMLLLVLTLRLLMWVF